MSSGASNRLVAAYGLYYLDNRPFILRAAELHYFRVPANLWRVGLERLRDAGCNAIASYIPWSWHEPSPGTLDFGGRTHLQRHLTSFLEAVRDAGLQFMARPGPFISAEYPGQGYPAWLPEAIPQALARQRNGRRERSRHHQVYSLLHPDYLDRVCGWYAALADTLRPYVNAPVVTWQLDDDTGLTLANSLARLDFNPDTVARYRDFLSQRYETLDDLRREWRRPDVPAFAHVLPPRTLRSHGELADWQAFLEALVGQYLETLRSIVRDLGVGLPTVVNEAGDYVSPQSPLAKAPAADFYGFDSYAKTTGAPHTADFPFAASLHSLRFQQFAADERPLSCWELGTGWSSPRARGSPAVTVQSLGAAIAHGVKGYSLSAAHDSPAYPFGALLDEAGQPTDRLEAVARLQAFIAAHEEELTASVEVHDSIAWLDYQPYTRFGPEDFLPGGLPDPHRSFTRRALDGFHALLLTCGYNPVRFDLQSVDESALAGYHAAVFPSRGYLDLESYGKLVVFTLRGGSLVTLPQPPAREPDGTPFRSTFLWPHLPARIHRLDRARLMTHVLRHWAIPYHLLLPRRTSRLLPGALHLSHLFGPILADQAAPLQGAPLEWLADDAGPAAVARGLVPRPDVAPSTTAAPNETTTHVRGDYFLAEFPGAAQPVVRYGTGYRQPKRRGGTVALQSQVLLRHRGVPVAYRAQVRDGTSTVVGSLLGGAYVTLRYYALRASERLALRRFAVGLFEDAAPRQIVPDDSLEVEAIARLSPDGGCLLFVINRLGRQAGALRFPYPHLLNLANPLRAEVLYTAFGSRAFATGGSLHLDLAPDDMLVARLR